MDPAIVEGVEGILGIEELRQAIDDRLIEGEQIIHREEDVVAIHPQEADLNITRAVEHGENGEVFERGDAQTAIKQKMSYNRDQALKIYCMQWQLDVGATKTERSAYANEVLARGADVQLVEAFEGCCHEIQASLDSGGFLGLSWIKVAEDIQRGIEDSIKAHDPSENSRVATCWNNAAQAMQQAARYKAQLIKASVLHYTPEVTSLYKEIVAQYQTASTCYRVAAKPRIIQHTFYQEKIPNISCMKYIPDVFKRHFNSKNRSRASIHRTDWDDAAKALMSTATQLTQAAKALIKSNQATIQHNPELATFWNTMVIRYKELAVLPMPENTATYVCEEANSSPLYALNYHLFSAANVLEKATKAMDENDLVSAELWKKIALQHQRLGILWKQYGGKEEGKKDVGMNLLFTKRGSFHLSSASKAVKEAVQCMAENNPELAELWQRIAQQYQKAAKYDCKATTADHGEDEQWSCAVNAIEKSADQLRSAISALEKAAQTMRDGNKELAELWQKTALQYQDAANYYEKASLAAANGETTESDLWSHTGNLASSSAEQLFLAAGALDRTTKVTAQNYQLLELWNKQALQHQELAHYFKKSADVIVREDAAEIIQPLPSQATESLPSDEQCPNAAISAKSSDSQLCNAKVALVKAAKAVQQGDQVLVDLLQYVALQYQEAAVYYLNAAEAYARGNEVKGSFFDNKGIAAQEEANLAEQEAKKINEAMKNP